MRLRITAIAAAAAALCALTGVGGASAAVTFDPATGTGFVGKGDVQLAFGWNNTQLQANATQVAFSHSSTDTYVATCSWITGEGTRGEKSHRRERTESTAVNGVVTYEARTSRQVTGFTLKGFGATTTTDTVPVVGGPCPGNLGHEGTWTEVTKTGSTSVLLATHGVTAHQILAPVEAAA